MKMKRMKLKIDLHVHNAEDIAERVSGTRGMPTPKEFIDLAVEKGYDAIAFTHHGLLFNDPEAFEYAKSKGLLLIPGVEAFINKKHVLLLNYLEKKHVLNFEALREIKNDRMLVIAPHPYYKAKFCLEDDLEANIDLFDAIEYSHFYTKWFNLNKKATRAAKKHQLPLVGNSDAHFTYQFGTTYSYVYAKEKSIEAIIEAIKEGQVEYVSSPLPTYRIVGLGIWAMFKVPYHLKNMSRKFALNHNLTPYKLRLLRQQWLAPISYIKNGIKAALLPEKSPMAQQEVVTT
jgi:predicted metal-dependent phosphoesterase TrpH